MNLNLDRDLLQKQRQVVAELIHTAPERRITRVERDLLEGVWELLSQLAVSIENTTRTYDHHTHQSPTQGDQAIDPPLESTS
jgi:hypothetical protein